MSGTQAVTTVLWDADGVLQRLPNGVEESMRPAVEGRLDDVDGFLADAYVTEKPALAGQVAWPDVLGPLLERWGIGHAYDEVLAVWLTIEPIQATHDLVQELRAAGVRCYLATNQAERRARHMSQEMGYAHLFDADGFYSHAMKLTKPDPRYFRHIVDALKIDPGEALFLDDRRDNVESARSVGLKAEVWSYAEDLDVLRAHLRRHGLAVRQP